MNLHGLLHWNLNPARIPIPPHRLGNIPHSSAGEAQEGSHLSLTWVGFPILFSLGDVSQDAFQSLTPKAGFEPATSRLTVGGSATELLGIVFFSLEFEV